MNKLFINTDGGSRGNPGPMAIGIVFSDGENVLYRCKEYIGEGTNNEAEYEAIIRALEILAKSAWFKDNNGMGGEVICRLDSKLVVEQLSGNFKVKQAHIRDLVTRVRAMTDVYKLSITFTHIPREQNSEADRLVNEALDEKLKHATRKN